MPTMNRVTRLILTALATEPLHGYGIIGWVKSTTKPPLRLAVGTLYGALDRLQRDELIELEREEILNGRARKYYRLTDTGRRALLATLENLETETSTAWSRLGLPRPGLST